MLDAALNKDFNHFYVQYQASSIQHQHDFSQAGSLMHIATCRFPRRLEEAGQEGVTSL